MFMNVVGDYLLWQCADHAVDEFVLMILQFVSWLEVLLLVLRIVA